MNGRASGVALAGKGGKAKVQIVGGFSHGAEYDRDEFDGFALRYLEARGYDVSGVETLVDDSRRPGHYVVVNTETSELVAAFQHRVDAAAFITSELRDRDLSGVERGEYQVDGPVDFNPSKEN